jgi:hypothetical protein
LIVAKELNLTLVQLREAMTPQELWLWHAFFELQRDEERKAMRKSQARRR